MTKTKDKSAYTNKRKDCRLPRNTRDCACASSRLYFSRSGGTSKITVPTPT
jgi:hypothetical protein